MVDILRHAALALLAAFLVSALVLGLGRLALGLITRDQRNRAFASDIQGEPGQHYRLRVEALQELIALYGSAAMAWLATFAVSLVLAPAWPWGAGIGWVWFLLGLLLLIPPGFAFHRLWQLVRDRAALVFVRDANIAIGHALQRTAIHGYRALHNVARPGGIIDHILIGANGVFVIQVVARRLPRKRGDEAVVVHEGGMLRFGTEKVVRPLGAARASARWLAEVLEPVTGHPMVVRTVIAIPGWRIRAQNPEGHLVVNEKNLMMVTGWTQPDAYLMNEDVARIQQQLSLWSKPI
ncbi:MAG: nuclease-related domain-containing protein [Gammaproteobacteria bacterium]|jgi:hypothetical protein